MQPMNKIPVIETSEGRIFETHAILRYIARISNNKTLYGGDSFEQANVDQWLDYINSEVLPPLSVLFKQTFGYVEYNKEIFDSALNEIKKLLSNLNT